MDKYNKLTKDKRIKSRHLPFIHHPYSRTFSPPSCPLRQPNPHVLNFSYEIDKYEVYGEKLNFIFIFNIRLRQYPFLMIDIENKINNVRNTEGQTESELKLMLINFSEEQKLLHTKTKKYIKNQLFIVGNWTMSV